LTYSRRWSISTPLKLLRIPCDLKSTTFSIELHCNQSLRHSRIRASDSDVVDLSVQKDDLSVDRTSVRVDTNGALLSRRSWYYHSTGCLASPSSGSTCSRHYWIAYYSSQKCHLQAATVGSYCWIGCSVVLGPRVIVKDCCVFADNVTIPADIVIPPLSRVTVASTGSSSDEQPTSRLVFCELPPSTAHELQEQSMELYQNFVVLQQQREVSLNHYCLKFQ
jgi:hypothetical protein